ncbi:hypothetical protein [Mobilicoccus pelagius]|uniref:Lipoprotein n=1 Tax=Mobilicoccus pelagius NBRC 104925 TaxID=1089455 RepID=H5USC9_9MICO|nr:hypothetical protein [Mobilicoccus pelagius]GAB48637.1 hypothetical protein MOPEL_078_00260 [Mobilicoccus pelagius NBRC 104925]
MKLHRSRRLVAGVALLAALPLTGCTTPGAEPGTAARVGDRTVSEKDVDAATVELAQVQLPQQIDASGVTQFLAIGPLLLDKMSDAGVPVGTAEARSQLQNPRMTLSKPTEEVLRTYVALQEVNQAQQILQQGVGDARLTSQARKVAAANDAFEQELRTYVTDGRVEVNPKYAKLPVNWVYQNGMGTQAPEGQDAPREAPAQ